MAVNYNFSAMAYYWIVRSDITLQTTNWLLIGSYTVRCMQKTLRLYINALRLPQPKSVQTILLQNLILHMLESIALGWDMS